MKKVAIGAALVAVLGIGGTFAVVSVNEEQKNEVTSKSVKVASEETKQMTIPTERTVELAAGATYPWQGASVGEVDRWIAQGEIVYLFSDLEAFEEAFVSIIDLDIAKNGANPAILKQRTDQIVKQLSPYKPEMKEYWDVLTEAGDLGSSGDYEAAKAKIEEAKQLREAQ
jgi:hypothetical protein